MSVEANTAIAAELERIEKFIIHRRARGVSPDETLKLVLGLLRTTREAAERPT